jgi:hypothetical protein
MIRQLSLQSITPSNRPYAVVQDDVLKRASNLSEATSRLIVNVGAPPAVMKESVNNYLAAYKAFYTVTLEMAAHQV